MFNNEPPAGTTTAPADRTLVDVARLYYEHGLTHQQIAAELGLSRVKVTRLLAQARATGVVEISINGPDEPFADLIARLQQRFGLDRVWVAPSLPDQDQAQLAIDRGGAAAIEAVVEHRELVGIGLSSTLGRAIQLVAQRDQAPEVAVSCLPMSGGWGGWQKGINPGELAQRLARRLNGRSFGFPAPLLAPSAEFARVLSSLPEVIDALDMASRADALLFGVGGLDWSTSQLRDSVSEDERAQLLERGAVGDIAARFFDADGQPVDSDVDRRVIGLSLAGMRQVPQRLLLAHGQGKVEALYTALSAGMATGLVTDSATARALLR
ncbi:sugar-binding transcriptional regulator [Propionibacteriaceae bacterium G1746]|uniref:sugar-binding transcriptional regulator n=1 Tax=Aestuariimicrobium sp. G57 TaxID=3418485 RepID=UPI003C1E3A2B